MVGTWGAPAGAAVFMEKDGEEGRILFCLEKRRT